MTNVGGSIRLRTRLDGLVGGCARLQIMFHFLLPGQLTLVNTLDSPVSNGLEIKLTSVFVAASLG